MQSESRVELIKQMFNCLLILLTLSPPPPFLRPLWLQAQVVSWALCLCPGKLHQGSQHFGKRSLKDHHYWQFTTSLCISGETPTPDMQVLPGYQQASEILTMSRIMKKIFWDFIRLSLYYELDITGIYSWIFSTKIHLNTSDSWTKFQIWLNTKCQCLFFGTSLETCLIQWNWQFVSKRAHNVPPTPLFRSALMPEFRNRSYIDR